MADKKLYVLDTNVLVHDANALFSFDNVLVGIPSIVLEEMDTFKREPSARGRNTREVIRQLDMLRERGSLQEGVRLSNGATVKVLFMPADDPLTLPFRMDENDNEILLVALSYQQKGYAVTFVSKDLNARVKADALGIAASDYLKERVSEDRFYKGWIRIQVPAVELKREQPDAFKELLESRTLIPNQYILVESRSNPFNYQVFRYHGGARFSLVKEPHFKWPLKPRNSQQLMALDALLDDSIQLLTLFGPAGTGKTFITLLAGLHKVMIEKEYRKMLISRPVVPLGKDIGYLPGTIEEKLHSWMLPIYDNIDLITHSVDAGSPVGSNHDGPYRGKHKKRRKGHDDRRKVGMRGIEDLIKQDKLSLEAITYMRGRSIPYQFILIDEVQNLNPHEVKTLVSRVGQGSKIVLTGDPYQIDSPYLDFSSNGLVVTSEKFKGQPLFSTVYLETSERSELSQLANELL